MKNFLVLGNGFKIKPLASAPTPVSDGDVYYDSTLATFRVRENGKWNDIGGTTLQQAYDSDPGSGEVTITVGSAPLVINGSLAEPLRISSGVRLQSSPSNYINLTVDPSASSTYTLTLPVTAPSDTSILTVASGGSMSWQEFSGSGGSVTSGNSGIAVAGTAVSLVVDDTSLEVSASGARVKASGINSTHLAGSIPDSKLEQIATAGKVNAAALTGSAALSSLSVAGALNLPTATNATNTIDARNGSTWINTPTGSRTVNIHHLADGQTVSILCAGAANVVITIAAYSDAGSTSVPVKFGAGQNGTMSSSYSLFTIYRIAGAVNWAVVGPIHGLA